MEKVICAGISDCYTGQFWSFRDRRPSAVSEVEDYKTGAGCSGVIPVNTISFLSGCTVFSMAVISVGKQIYSGKKQNFDRKKGSWLAAGAVAGGIAGKSLYQMILRRLPDTQRVGAVQAAVLLAVTAGTLIYTLKKDRIITKHVTNRTACAVIGMMLGIMSAFLGIGGGPVNLVVLFYFFCHGEQNKQLYTRSILLRFHNLRVL